MKSSKALARKILCGLLAAGVVGVSGSALAAQVKASYYLGRTKEITANEYIDNAGAIIYAYGGNDTNLVSITTNENIKTLSITNNSNNGDAYGVYAYDNQASGVGSKIELGTTNTDTINITANGLTDKSWAAGICAWKGGEVDVTAKNLNINVDAKNGIIVIITWINTPISKEKIKYLLLKNPIWKIDFLSLRKSNECTSWETDNTINAMVWG